jgi:hypothetical protein
LLQNGAHAINVHKNFLKLRTRGVLMLRITGIALYRTEAVLFRQAAARNNKNKRKKSKRTA